MHVMKKETGIAKECPAYLEQWKTHHGGKTLHTTRLPLVKIQIYLKVQSLN